MKRTICVAVAALCLSGCGVDPSLNSDGDCMTDVEELELGTDPDKADADADADGISDCEEYVLERIPRLRTLMAMERLMQRKLPA